MISCFKLVLFFCLITFSCAQSLSHLPNIKHENVKPDSSSLFVKNKSNIVPNLSNKKTANSQVDEKNSVQSNQLLATSMECSQDVAKLCYTARHDLEVLTCLNNAVSKSSISPECHNLMWHFKLNLTKHVKFDEKAEEYCTSISKEHNYGCFLHSKGTGKIIPCLMDYLDNFGMKDTRCSKYIQQFASIIFTDYRLVCNFMEDCYNDVKNQKCGVIDSEDFTKIRSRPPGAHFQGKVIACLEEKMIANQSQISEKCVKQILRLNEIQSDAYNMDRNLYYNCKRDKEILCESIEAEKGAVYECLFKHKFDNVMSSGCRKAITLRQKIISSQDYKVNFYVNEMCENDIRKNNCLEKVKKASNDYNDHIGLSSISLCLEQAKLNGNELNHQCEGALKSFRKQLMEDYEISSEIVHNCASIIQNECDGGLNKQGTTIHCIMNIINKNPDKYPECQQAVMDLVRGSDVANDFQIDHSLSMSCQKSVETICSNFAFSDAALLSCLLDNFNSNLMDDGCKIKLTDLQYFLSRDFMIDQSFHDSCSEDAEIFCGSSRNIQHIEKSGFSFGLVLSCLYRYVSAFTVHNKGKKLKPKCEQQVHAILRVRALEYKLNPELDSACRSQLGLYCSDNELIGKGDEFKCLQRNYEKLGVGSPCQLEIQKLTGMQGEDVMDVDKILVQECERMLSIYCQDELENNGDEKTVMECLVRNKHLMKSESHKCVAGIEHFQLIEMKDYNFDKKFIEKCKDDVEAFCNLDSKKVITKGDVVECLSKNIRDAILSEKESKISSGCREQLTTEKLEIYENVDLNPDLKLNCEQDVQSFCRNELKDEVLECLRKYKVKLTQSCRKHVFKIQLDEAKVPKLDFQLMRACKVDLKNKCMDKLRRNDKVQTMECLILNKDNLSKHCKKVVIERESEMFDDVTLNGDLMESCHEEIYTECSYELNLLRKNQEDGDDPKGVVYSCLKKLFARQNKMEKKLMSDKCKKHILFVIQEQENNYQMNPQLMLYCINPIKNYCNNQDEVECLKKMFFDDKLKFHKNCMKEVANLIMESRSDINADPVLLGKCAIDVEKYCRGVPQGGGKKIKCLLDADYKFPDLLLPQCKEELLMRQSMWKAVNMNEGLQDILLNVKKSRNSTQILIILAAIFFSILLFGCMLGRITKNAKYQQLKTK